MEPSVLSHDQILQRLCQAQQHPGLYLRFSFPDDAENPSAQVCQAVPLLADLSDTARSQLLADGLGFVFFETIEAMREAAEQIVGPDGPKRQHTYRGPAYAYAVACDATGQILGDNTASSPEDP